MVAETRAELQNKIITPSFMHLCGGLRTPSRSQTSNMMISDTVRRPERLIKSVFFILNLTLHILFD